MIHEIARELRALLETAGVPMPVVDGPERTTSAVTPRERIVVELLDAEHPLLPPKGANTRNPVHVRDPSFRRRSRSTRRTLARARSTTST
ncbi:MAG: hypothetical protein IPF92_21450 [Myxococcales bacterium]|nr:hypothetical protein [Myxococcales bacterium]